MKPIARSFASILLLAVFAQPFSTTSAYTITAFGPSAFDSDTSVMDATLGISGFAIEKFEDSPFLSELSITYSGDVFGPLNSAPYNWDGDKTLQHNTGEAGQFITFSILGGASVFGIGLSDVQVAGHTIAINSGAASVYTGLPGVVLGSPGRSAYLLVSRETGDAPISSVTFTVADGDGINYDRLAFRAVPAPPTLALLGMALVWLAGVRVRRAA